MYLFSFQYDYAKRFATYSKVVNLKPMLNVILFNYINFSKSISIKISFLKLLVTTAGFRNELISDGI